MFAQLPQSELEGLDPSCRRFRLENGESIAEKDEVCTNRKVIPRVDPRKAHPNDFNVRNYLGIRIPQYADPGESRASNPVVF